MQNKKQLHNVYFPKKWKYLLVLKDFIAKKVRLALCHVQRENFVHKDPNMNSLAILTLKLIIVYNARQDSTDSV